MLGETENQFSLTRAALSTGGRAKSKFLSVDEPTDRVVVARRRAPDMFQRMRLCSVLFVASIAPAALSAPPAEAVKLPAPMTSGYNQPPKHVLDVLHAPAPPRPYVSPTRDTILLVSWVQYPAMTQVAEPFLKLAGVRVEPRTRRKHDTPGGYGVARCAQTFALVDIATSKETPVQLPPPAQSLAEPIRLRA